MPGHISNTRGRVCFSRVFYDGIFIAVFSLIHVSSRKTYARKIMQLNLGDYNEHLLFLNNCLVIYTYILWLKALNRSILQFLTDVSKAIGIWQHRYIYLLL